MADKHLLIVAHAPSDNTRRLVDAVIRGARHPDIEGVVVTWKPPLEAQPADVLQADAIILGTTENLGYMSGALKDFFDRCYYPVLEKNRACPVRSISAQGLMARVLAGQCNQSSPDCAGSGCRNRWCSRGIGRMPLLIKRRSWV